jgi:nucleoid-associated protein YgaU
MSRYIGRKTGINRNKLHKKKLDKRGIKKVTQYKTPTFRSATDADMFGMDLHFYTWGTGDSFWKLSTAFYGDPQYWWVIAAINRTPTESMIEIGSTIAIPYDLSAALQVVE